jgi:hypothetical protein
MSQRQPVRSQGVRVNRAAASKTVGKCGADPNDWVRRNDATGDPPAYALLEVVKLLIIGVEVIASDMVAMTRGAEEGHHSQM